MAKQVPFVDYLVLGDGAGKGAQLVANECTACGARFFDRRVACAKCSSTAFRKAAVATEGTLRAFTIVHTSTPGVKTPYAAMLVDCVGTSVRGNLVGMDPDPAKLKLGMKLRLATFSLGIDEAGTEAINYGFSPA